MEHHKTNVICLFFQAYQVRRLARSIVVEDDIKSGNHVLLRDTLLD